MTAYETLGIPSTATPEEIKAAYRAKAGKAHPDRGGIEEEFKRVRAAYEALTEGAEKFAEEVLRELNNLIISALSNEHEDFADHQDLRAFLENSIKAKQVAYRQSMRNNERTRKRWEKLRTRYKRRDGGREIIEQICDRQLEIGMEANDGIAHGLLVGDAMLAHIRGYAYAEASALPFK